MGPTIIFDDAFASDQATGCVARCSHIAHAHLTHVWKCMAALPERTHPFTGRSEGKEGGRKRRIRLLYVEQNSCVDGRERKQTVTATGAEVADVCANGEFIRTSRKATGDITNRVGSNLIFYFLFF